MKLAVKISRKVLRGARLLSSSADWALRVKPRFGSDPGRYRKFIIVGEGRTGTNLLVSALQSQKQFVCFGELFHPHAPIWFYDHIDWANRSNNIGIGDECAEKFLKESVWCKYRHNIKAVGFKLIYWHFYPEVRPRVMKAINMYPDIHVIHIWREDLIKWYTSLMLAERDQVWTEKKSAQSSARTIYIDPDKAIERIEQHVRMRARVHKIFPHNPSLSFSYEELSRNIDGVINITSSFLGVNRVNLVSTPLQKQGSDSLRDVIENYDELMATLSRRPRWAALQDQNNDFRL